MAQFQDHDVVCEPVIVYSGHKRVYYQIEHVSIQALGFRFLEALVRRLTCAADGCRNVEQPEEGIPDEFERSFNVADSLLMEEILGEALLRRLPPSILVISTDRDFSLATRALHTTGKYNVLVARKRNTNGDLPPTPFALATWEWARMQ
ncbi:unnamed protein product [Arabidopsis halleri]